MTSFETKRYNNYEAVHILRGPKTDMPQSALCLSWAIQNGLHWATFFPVLTTEQPELANCDRCVELQYTEWATR